MKEILKPMRITIIGLGLIGGSLAIALKEAAPSCLKITVVDRDFDTLKLAVDYNAFDCITDNLIAAVRDADIVFLCTPVLQIMDVARTIIPYLKPDTILTDVGSTKLHLKTELNKILPSCIYYIGGHPMAGREKSGLSAADKNLFQNKYYILIPSTGTPAEKLEELCCIVRLTGAKITFMNVEEHDRCAAVISHLPHVAAAAMVRLLEWYPDPETCLKLAGGGFRDTTRIASSDADMWSDICITNGNAINESLSEFQRILSEVAQAIQQGDRKKLHAFFSQAKQRRDDLLIRIENKEKVNK